MRKLRLGESGHEMIKQRPTHIQAHDIYNVSVSPGENCNNNEDLLSAHHTSGASPKLLYVVFTILLQCSHCSLSTDGKIKAQGWGSDLSLVR